MACSSGELHAICFLWAHVFYVLILPLVIDYHDILWYNDVLDLLSRQSVQTVAEQIVLARICI